MSHPVRAVQRIATNRRVDLLCPQASIARARRVGPHCPRWFRERAGRQRHPLTTPKAELQAHKAAFREVFGETLSDEFVDEMLTRLVTALAPGPWDVLEA